MNHVRMSIEHAANMTRPPETTLASGEGQAGLSALAFLILLVVGRVTDASSRGVAVGFAAWALLTVVICVVGARRRRTYKQQMSVWQADLNDELGKQSAAVDEVQSRAPAPRLQISWGARYTPDAPDDQIAWFDERADPVSEATAAVADGVRKGLGSVLVRRERVVFDWSAPHEVTEDRPTALAEGAHVDVVAIEMRYMTGTLGHAPGREDTLSLHNDQHDVWSRLHPVGDAARSRGMDRVHVIVPSPGSSPSPS